MTLTFTLPRPPSINGAYFNKKNGGRAKTDSANTFAFLASVELARQHVRGIKGKVIITYDVGRIADRRRRDVGNYEKLLSDSLVANGIIEDDSLIERLSIGWVDGVEGVRVTVEAAGALAVRQRGRKPGRSSRRSNCGRSQ